MSVHSSATFEQRAVPANNRPPREAMMASPVTRILIAVVLLFALSAIIGPSSVGSTALVSMLPFAALTAVVAIGQTLVIQQGGLDLSIAGAITLGALVTTTYGNDPAVGGTGAILLAVFGVSLFGALSGALVALFDLPPLVVTIASNALMIGVAQQISGGSSVTSSPSLSSFALSRVAGIPTLAVIALGLTILGQCVLKLTRAGRRFELVGENRRSAQVIGIARRKHVISAYWLSALLAGGAGVLLAGLLQAPTLTAGDSYLLPSVVAVVLGGTPLTGGRGSIAGTALAALFLGQLNELLQIFTQTTAVQNLVQALIIGVCVALQLQLGGGAAKLRALVCHLPLSVKQTIRSSREGG